MSEQPIPLFFDGLKRPLDFDPSSFFVSEEYTRALSLLHSQLETQHTHLQSIALQREFGLNVEADDHRGLLDALAHYYASNIGKKYREWLHARGERVAGVALSEIAVRTGEGLRRAETFIESALGKVGVVMDGHMREKFLQAVTKKVQDASYNYFSKLKNKKHNNSISDSSLALVDKNMPGEILASNIDYFGQALIPSIGSVISGETDCVANMANVASILYHDIQRLRGPRSVNWVGFYLLRPASTSHSYHKEHSLSVLSEFNDVQLVLGPFQGKVACIRIAIGRGVCGTCAKTRMTQLVPDVHKFPGHISCDSESNSELVVPIINNNKLIGVLDLDSPLLNFWTEEDAKGVEIIADMLAKQCIWPDK